MFVHRALGSIAFALASLLLNAAEAQTPTDDAWQSETSIGVGVESSQVPTTASPAPNLGGVGESCTRRADCETGLHCLANTCRHPSEGLSCEAARDCPAQLECRSNVCEAAQMPFDSASGPSIVEEPWAAFGGTRFFFGAWGSGGISWFSPRTYDGARYVQGSAGLFLRTGVMLGENAIGLEVAPVTAWHVVEGDPQLVVSASYARYLPISDRLFWRLYGGIGTAVVNAPASLHFAIEAIGLVYRAGPLMLEVNAPSVRVNLLPEDPIRAWFSFFLMIGVSYVTDPLE